MNDNVTPFPTPPKKPVFDVRDPRHQTFLVYGLTVLAFAINWTGNTFVNWIGLGLGIAALAISASKRDEGAFWARSHFEFVLRTLIIGGVIWMAVSLVGGVLSFLVGWLLQLIPLLGGPLRWLLTDGPKVVVLVWVGVRCAVGFLRAADAKVIANPVTWLI